MMRKFIPVLLMLFVLLLFCKILLVEESEIDRNTTYLYFYDGGELLRVTDGKIKEYDRDKVVLIGEGLPYSFLKISFGDEKEAVYRFLPQSSDVFVLRVPIDMRDYFTIGGDALDGEPSLLKLEGESRPILGITGENGERLSQKSRRVSIVAFVPGVRFFSPENGNRNVPVVPVDKEKFLTLIRTKKITPITTGESDNGFFTYKDFVILIKIGKIYATGKHRVGGKEKYFLSRKKALIIKVVKKNARPGIIKLVKEKNLRLKNGLLLVPERISVRGNFTLSGTAPLLKGNLFSNIENLFSRKKIPVFYPGLVDVFTNRPKIFRNGNYLYYPPSGIAISKNVIIAGVTDKKEKQKGKLRRVIGTLEDAPYLYLFSGRFASSMHYVTAFPLADEIFYVLKPESKEFEIAANGKITVFSENGSKIYEDSENIYYTSEPYRYVRKIEGINPSENITVKVKRIKRIPECGEVIVSFEKHNLWYRLSNGQERKFIVKEIPLPDGKKAFEYRISGVLNPFELTEIEVRADKRVSVFISSSPSVVAQRITIGKRWRKIHFYPQLICVARKESRSIDSFNTGLISLSSSRKRKLKKSGKENHSFKVPTYLLPVYGIPGNFGLLAKYAPDELSVDPELSKKVADVLFKEVEIVKEELQKRFKKQAKELFIEAGVVVLDAKTREVIAMASYPYPDTVLNRKMLLYRDSWNSKKSLLQNRALVMNVHPGSTFKILTSIAAFKSGVITPHNNTIEEILGKDNLKGVSFKGSELPISQSNFRREKVKHADFLNAFAHSYNIYFSYLSLLMEKKLERGYRNSLRPIYFSSEEREKEFPLIKVARDAGFNRNLLADIYSKSRFPDVFEYPKEVADAGIGQFEITASPLQMATIAGIIYDGRLVYPSVRKNSERIINTDYLDEKCRSYIEKAMHLVITEGTAKTTFKNFPYKDKIFGKTGTAENGKSKEFKGVEDGWFVAYTKGINRDIIVSVCIRYSGTGGGHSAKVAREILRLWIEQSLQKGGNENVSDKNV